MKISYLRVSDVQQKIDRQIEIMKEKGIEKFFVDKCSGKDTNRKSLQEMLDFIRENDQIYIESFSRLARSTKDLITLVEYITETKKAHLISLKENIDTTTPAGRMMLGVIGSIFQFEREVLLSKDRWKEYVWP